MEPFPNGSNASKVLRSPTAFLTIDSTVTGMQGSTAAPGIILTRFPRLGLRRMDRPKQRPRPWLDCALVNGYCKIEIYQPYLRSRWSIPSVSVYSFSASGSNHETLRVPQARGVFYAFSANNGRKERPPKPQRKPQPNCSGERARDSKTTGKWFSLQLISRH